VHALRAPCYVGDAQFDVVRRPRLDEDPSRRWLRQVVSSVAARTSTAREN